MALTDTLRHRLILGTAMAGALLTGYGRAFAGSCTAAGGSYLCSGAAATPAGSDTPLTLNFVSPIFGASTLTGFGIDSSSTAATAITINASGASLSFTDNYNSVIKGGTDGIDAFNKTTGAAAITVSGAVTGVAGDGIKAINYGTSTNLIITTGANGPISGSNIGIDALNNGKGATTITANGNVTSHGAYGIEAINGATATDIIITTGAAHSVTGTNIGIYALNNGTGVTTVTANGVVTGTDAYGIRAINGSTATKLTVTSGDASTVTGAKMGIYALNQGTGATIVTAGGIVKGTTSEGIYAGNTATATDLIITTDATSNVSGTYGILAVNNGKGATTITTNGTVAGTNAGIYAFNNATGMKTTITANGTVTGKDAIRAVNSSTAGDMVITTGAASTATGTNFGIYAVNNGTGATIVTANGAVTGTAADGIYASNASTGTDLIITTGAASTVKGVDGIVAVNGGKGVTTITTYGTVTGTNAGIYAFSNGTKTTITANGTVTGKDAIEAVNSSTAGDMIITTGAASKATGTNFGIYAVNNGTGATTITANGVVTGTTVDGIYAGNSSTATDLIITTGADSVVSGVDGVVAVNNGKGATTITTNGAVTGTNIGIYALNNGTGTKTTITANGTVSGVDGIEAKNASTAGDMIITTGAASKVTGSNIGIYALNKGIGATTITANGAVTGTATDGIYAGNASTATTLIITTGAASTVTGKDGIVAVNSGKGATTITTNGAVTGTNIGIYALNKGSAATTITANGVVSGVDGIEAKNYATAGALIVTTGADSTVTGTNIGLYTLNKGAGATTITAKGAVTGTNIGIYALNQGTGTTAITTAGVTQGGVSGISAVSSAGQAITISNSGTVENSSGLASALAVKSAGGATKVINSGRLIGTVALGDLGSTVDNTGIWDTAGGTNTFGALTASNGVTNEAGGTIVAADDASAAQHTIFTNVGTFTNAGILTMVDGRAGDTTTINGDFVGTGGIVKLDTVVGTDGSPSDVLVINGDASGSTRLAINNVGGAGGLTSANGIEVVDVTGTSTPTAFRLAAAVGGGIYDYGLYYSSLDPSADDQNWYLRSTGKLNASTQTIRPYADTLVNFAEATVGTLQQRTSNRIWPGGVQQQVAADLPSNQVMTYAATGPVLSAAGAWGRVGGQYGSYDPDKGSSYNQSIGFLQAGYEGTTAETVAGDVTVGVFATVGTSTSQVDITNDPVTGAARAKGKITSTGYGLGADLTWLGNDGTYVDGVAQVTKYDTSLSNKPAGSDSGWSSVVSLEAGHRFDLGSGWAIVPQTQLAWTHVDFSPFTDVNDARIAIGDGDSLKGRVGVRVENITSWRNVIGPAERLQLYGVANLTYQFLNGTSVVVEGHSLTQQDKRLWGEVGLGGTYAWNDRWSLYGEAYYAAALSAGAGENYTLTGTAGLRYRW